VAYFPETDVSSNAGIATSKPPSTLTLGLRPGTPSVRRKAGHREGRGNTLICPTYASELRARIVVCLAGHDAFYEEDETDHGHAA